VPIVLTSGYCEHEATRRLVGRARLGFIQKPWTVQVLLEEIESTIVTE